MIMVDTYGPCHEWLELDTETELVRICCNDGYRGEWHNQVEALSLDKPWYIGSEGDDDQ
jgi:hypothetical protein